MLQLLQFWKHGTCNTGNCSSFPESRYALFCLFLMFMAALPRSRSTREGACAQSPGPRANTSPRPCSRPFHGRVCRQLEQANGSDTKGIIGPLTLPMLIGIGAGILAIALCALLLMVFCCFRRKRSSRKGLDPRA